MTTDWTAGYRTDIGYTESYFSELNPLHARLALTNAGIACPAITSACELGFGQGLTINCNAAATDAKWYGNDFNALHAARAQQLANIVCAGAELSEDSFVQYANRSDLPDFDYIGLHGIWSWVSIENRHVIVDFIRRKLKPGGIVYLSYNTMVGSAAFEPVRHLMVQHAKVLGAEGRGISGRVDDAVGFMNQMFAMKSVFEKFNPAAVLRMKSLANKNRQYLAHEYFNKDWHPMHFADVADTLHAAKLNFACSAHLMDHVDDANFNAGQQKFLNAIPEPLFKEATKDLMLYRQFRKDFWVKGARELTILEKRQQLRSLRFVMVKPRVEVPEKLNCNVGEAKLDAAIYGPPLELMEDHQPRSLGEIEKMLVKTKLTLPQIREAIMVLTAQEVLCPAQVAAKADERRPYTDKINAELLHRARLNIDTPYLVSPITGGALPVQRLQQLFLLALAQGKKSAEQGAEFAWQVLSETGQKLVREGKEVQSAEANLSILKSDARAFAKTRLPILKALQVTD